MGVQWIEHNGRKILYFDHRNMQPEQILANLEIGNEMVTDISGGLRILTNFENAVVSTEVMQALKTYGAEIMEPISEKSAVVGIRGFKQFLLQSYNRIVGVGENQRTFETEEEALEWLAS